MKKKVTQKVKGLSSKPKKKKVVSKPSSRSKIVRPKPVSKIVVKVDPRYTQAVQNYEAGVKAMQLQKFERAKAAFEKVLEGPSNELADRARMNLNICKQSLAKFTTHFKTTEEHYDYAIALMNSGDYDGARSHLDKLVKQHPNADYAHYGLGVLDCLTGRTEQAFGHLAQSIKLNISNRFQARNDSDFAAVADDPRFTELIYPEPEMPSEPVAAPPAKKR